jgi:hypothetical protein
VVEVVDFRKCKMPRIQQANSRDHGKADADKRLRHFVEENLKTFNPAHNGPADIPVEIVEWIITTEMLNA